MFEQFIIPPKIDDYFAKIPVPYRPALEKVLSDEYRKYDDDFSIEYDKRKKARENHQKLKCLK